MTQGFFGYLFGSNQNLLAQKTNQNSQEATQNYNPNQQIEVVDTGSSLEIGNGLTIYYEPYFMEIIEGRTIFSCLKNQGQRCLSLNFMPTTPTQTDLISKAKLSEQAFVIQAFCQAFLKLVDILQVDNRFGDVIYIKGNTDKKVIDFCQKMGFGILADFPSIIYITKDDLCSDLTKDLLEQKLTQANRILEKQKS